MVGWELKRETVSSHKKNTMLQNFAVFPEQGPGGHSGTVSSRNTKERMVHPRNLHYGYSKPTGPGKGMSLMANSGAPGFQFPEWCFSFPRFYFPGFGFSVPVVFPVPVGVFSSQLPRGCFGFPHWCL